MLQTKEGACLRDIESRNIVSKKIMLILHLKLDLRTASGCPPVPAMKIDNEAQLRHVHVEFGHP